MDPSPDRRYATARDMALDIERAVTPALPSEVADWVQRTAHEALGRRASLVREIEREHFIESAKASGVGPGPHAVTAPPEAPQRRAPVVVAAAALGCMIAVAAGLWLRGWHGRQAEAEAPGSSSQASITTATSTSTATSTPSATSTAEDHEAETAAPSAATSAPATTKHHHHSDCDPPFIRDANGAKVWKRECL
jgi:eukaryotic-like serine/threonine-protein kinase